MTVTRRSVTGFGVALVALVGAVSGALLSGSDGGPLALAVASISTRTGDLLGAIGRTLPFGYAFAAGMAAAVNPCGFALLPAYLGLYLGTGDVVTAGPRPLIRALAVGGTMTASFVGLFGLAGLALATAAAVLVDLLPWLSVLVGALLVVAGARMLAGAPLYAAGAERLSARVGGVAWRADVVGYAAYGVAFALSSLGCTLPLFLTVVGAALTTGGLAAAAGQFVLYALGMGAVVTTATVLVALFGKTLVVWIARPGRYLGPASAVLLIVTGAYVVYYWLAVGGLLG